MVGAHAERDSGRGSGSVYAAIHEYGGTIEPRNGEFLVFQGADGRLVFARSVEIPERPYVSTSTADVFRKTQQAQRIAELTVAEWIRRSEQ